MKKKIALFLSLCALCGALCGCQSKTEAPTANSLPAEDIIAVDLAALSDTMVYAEVYQMNASPKDYIGKTVRMRGQFSAYEDPKTGVIYFACLVSDATACCQQGLEFALAGNPKYPADYPEPGSEITVTGVFQTYLENGNTYCQLADARLTK